jgi:hypothetical protein
MIKANEGLIADIAKVKREIAGLGTAMAALPDKRIKIDVDTAGAMAKIAELRSALDGLGDRHISVGGDNGAMIRELRDISASMDQATSSMGRMEEHLVAIKRDVADSSADLMMQTQVLRDNASAHTAAADAVTTLAAAHRNAGGGGGGWGTAAAAAAGGAAGRGGGGGRGRWTAAAYGAAGAGAGPDFPPGSAGAQANAIVGFVKRWWAPVHWAIMATNEVLATAGPAVAAAGAATLVGWQGVEQMVPRIKAINATAESIGPAYGITSGQYLGTGRTLQNFQDRATGGVYELGGAGINLMRGGAGSFGQMGLNTIAMLDRGVAGMQVNMAQRGTMGTLAQMLGGGTEYMRTFGDIGANVGNMFLGLGPHLPGVGGDYLSALKGITGAAAGGIGFMNQHGMGSALGLGLAGEAGLRVGTPMVGLLGRLLGGTGRGLAGLSNLVKPGPGLLGRAGVGLGDAGLGLAGFGDALGMLGGPEVALLAMSAFAGSKLISSMPTGAMRRVSGLQAGIGQAGFSEAWQPLARAITTTTGLGARPAGGLRALQQVETPYEIGRFGPGITPTYADTYKAAAQGFTGQLGNLVGAGPQLVADLKKAGLKSVNMGDAFQIAQNSLLDLSHAFDSHGHLTKQAGQMLKNYVSAIGPMTQSGGAFNAAIGAQQIMSSPAMKNLSQVNQAMDSMTQIMTGGASGMSALFGMLGGAHPAGKAPPAMSQMAKALTSFTTPGGAAAWQKFAGPSGLITAEQANLDQLRTGLTLGAIGPGGAAGLAGFQLQQMLPMAAKSPAALSMLMQQGQQMGIGGYYDQSKSFAQNLKDAQSSFAKIADTSKQANAATTSMTVKLSNIPAVAKQFVQGTGAKIQAQQVAKAAQDAVNIKGGINIKANTADLVGQLRAAGVQGGGALKASLDAVLRQAGVSKAMRLKIEGQYFPPHIPKPPDQHFGIKGHVTMPPIPRVPDQSFTITGHVVMVGGQVSPYTPAGARANLGPAAYFHPAAAGINPSAYTHLQTGGMVPGSGHGDIIPAMLEPGEAIIPRYLVPLIAPILAAHRVPGFGGMPQSSSSHFADGGLVPHALGFPDPVNLQGKAGQFAFTLIDGITKALNATGAKKIADALVTQIGKEVTLAKNVSSAAMKGQGFGDSGMFGSMDVTPGTGGGTVQEQMQSYLGSVKSFTKDIGALRKGHLNKAIISQLVAAGPVQGDALAQSIMNDYGGIKSVNSLYGQLGHATKGLGAQAAMAQFGGMLAPNLKSGSFSSTNVSININAGGGATLSLSDAQIKAVVAKVQAALLKQAKRNNKTGLQLPTKGA